MRTNRQSAIRTPESPAPKGRTDPDQSRERVDQKGQEEGWSPGVEHRGFGPAARGGGGEAVGEAAGGAGGAGGARGTLAGQPREGACIHSLGRERRRDAQNEQSRQDTHHPQPTEDVGRGGILGQ